MFGFVAHPPLGAADGVEDRRFPLRGNAENADHPRQPWPWRDPLPEPDAPSRPPRVATDRVSLCPSTILERAEGLVARGLFREARDYLTGRHPVAEVVRSLGHPGWTARLERCLARLDGAATG